MEIPTEGAAKAKYLSAAKAMEFVKPGMKLGLGTGSTAAYFVDLLKTKSFDIVLLRLGLGRFPLTPGCLRPGGATRLFLAGKAISSLKYAGRWRAETSLEVYVQEAMCHLASTEMSDIQSLKQFNSCCRFLSSSGLAPRPELGARCFLGAHNGIRRPSPR